jgi:hypothetical protein
MIGLFRWLLERERTKQMVVWRMTVDRAEDMTMRFVESMGDHPPPGLVMRVFRDVVDAHRCQHSARLEFEQAEKLANDTLTRLGRLPRG